MMKHWCGPLAEEPESQREERVQFEWWMENSYPGLVKDFGLEKNPHSGYYTNSSVNCSWELWLYKS